MKKTLTVVLAVILSIFVMAACGTTSAPADTAPADTAPADTSAPADTAAPAASGDILVGASVGNMTNPFFGGPEGVVAGMKKAAAEVGCTIDFVDANLDQAKQISDVEDMINSGIDLLLLDPLDPKSVTAILDACEAKGIPVVAYNSTVEEMHRLASAVVSDNYQAGFLGGKAMAEALNGEGEVVMYNYSVVEICAVRANGFRDALAEFGPNMRIVDEQEGDPTVDAAMPIMENMLQANPNITGVWALNDPSAQGIVAAIEAKGRLGEIVVIGVDGNEPNLLLIQQGKQHATVAQNALEIGYTTVMVGIDYANGKPVENLIYIPVTLIDITNVEEFL